MRPALIMLPILLVLGGCATRDENCLEVLGPSGLTPANVVALGQGEGVVVTWGGVIARTQNLARETEIEIIGYRLDDCARPMTSGPPEGRFIALHSGFLEPADYRAGRPITVTGRIASPRDGRVGEAEYRFPVLTETRTRLWPDPANSPQSSWAPYPRPWLGIGIGSGGIGGGVGVSF
ncbi:MAG: hypothetical protein EOM91_17605 [Sphingobacteriia bacterium]|nr:hypothetical protein [Sphingobacteriia bacterium]NCC41279.1 hypothetical protein [Gammaproteobacteria bacterium]